MASTEAKEIAFEIYDSASDLQGENLENLSALVYDTCTSFQMAIVEQMRGLDLKAGIVTEPDAVVEGMNGVPGHTIGFVEVNPESDELVAFDATIAQNGVTHKRRRARIWFGTAQSLSEQLKKEFGGDWDVFQINGAIGRFGAQAA